MSSSPPSTEAWLPGYDGTKFYTKTWAASSPNAVTLYLHGFADHIARYDEVHAVWASRGITVFAYDQRAFGRTALDDANKSLTSSYGKTSTTLELRDIQFWVDHLASKYPGLPLFLMGYSAGGTNAITFVCCTEGPPAPETIAKVSGVIAVSPFFTLVDPPALIIRTGGGLLSKLLPNVMIPTGIREEHFSRSPEEVEALKKDRWRQAAGSLRSIHHMLTRAAENVEYNWRAWPKNLPILIAHGAADPVNDPKSSQSFIDHLASTVDKTLLLIPDALHDMYHEIDGIPQRVTDEYIDWIEAHI